MVSACLSLLANLICSATLRMKAVCLYELSVIFCRTVWIMFQNIVRFIFIAVSPKPSLNHLLPIRAFVVVKFDFHLFIVLI